MNDVMRARPTFDVVRTDLFIGGPACGRRMRVLHGSRAIVPDRSNAASAVPTEREMRVSRPAVYIKDVWTGERFAFEFWRWEKISRDDCVALLFEHFMPPEGGADQYSAPLRPGLSRPQRLLPSGVR